MLTSKFSRVGLSCALTALLVVAAPGVRSSWAASASSTSIKLLNAQLPHGVSLSKASISQVDDAIKGAVAARPDLAVDILDAAIKAKSSAKPLGCKNLVSLVDAASAAAPDKTRELTESALALDPDCSSDLDSFLTDNNLPGLHAGGIGEGEFGAGFGPGYPGSPGFVGSSPGGTFPPPVGTEVTSTTNG